MGFIENIIVYTGLWGFALAILFFVCFVFAVINRINVFGKIASYKPDTGKTAPEGVSVILVTRDNLWYLDNTIPRFLNQKCDKYEIVIVDVGSSEDFADALAMLKTRHPQLTTTRVEQDPKFPINDKMAYNIGIKAARYDNIILTTPDTVPVSDRWIHHMASAFNDKKVVIGYCGIAGHKGFVNGMMRSQRLYDSVKYLSSALRGRTYKGVVNNMGFFKDIYFEKRGFGNLNMNVGTDDLFIQKLTAEYSSGIVINPYATVKQLQWGGFGWWTERKLAERATSKLYPQSVRNYLSWSVLVKALFLVSFIFVLILSPLWIKTGGVFLFLIWLVLSLYQDYVIRKKLHEKKLGVWCMIFNIAEPIILLTLTTLSKISKPAGVYR